MSNYHNSAIMSSGNRKWKSFEDLADWSSAMVPRLIKSFGLNIKFPLQYELSDDLKPGILGSFGLKTDEDELYGVIKISGSVLAKRDILAVLLHELIHAHCCSDILEKIAKTKNQINGALVDDLNKLKDDKDPDTVDGVNKSLEKSTANLQDLKDVMDDYKGHRGLFADLCREVGFGGKMTATEAKPALIKRLLALDFE